LTLAELGEQTYVNLATTRKDGREVRTPVWVAPDGERLVVWTNGGSGKVKRIRNGGASSLAPCDLRGGLKGDWVPVKARMLEDPVERDRALEAMFRKYGWQMQASRIFGSLSGRWKQRAAIEITLP
jgi:PPOX class probable F420-dependent enzyme